MKRFGRDFEGVKNAADTFVQWANNNLQEQDYCDFEVQTALPEKRQRKKKAMPGEMAEDEPLSDSLTENRVKVHNVIMDTVQESIYHRYTASAGPCSDFACMDSKNFAEIQKNGLPKSAQIIDQL